MEKEIKNPLINLLQGPIRFKTGKKQYLISQVSVASMETLKGMYKEG
jgi:hypothetical protein